MKKIFATILCLAITTPCFAAGHNSHCCRAMATGIVGNVLLAWKNAATTTTIMLNAEALKLQKL